MNRYKNKMVTHLPVPKSKTCIFYFLNFTAIFQLKIKALLIYHYENTCEFRGHIYDAPT